MSVNQSQHRHIDANLQQVKACPAAGANNYCDSIDTRSGGADIAVAGGSQVVDLLGSAALERMELACTLDVGTALVDGKLVTFTVYESQDDSSFTAAPTLAAQTIVGITGNGNAKTELRWKLPPTTMRYVKVNCSVPADAGTITAQNYTVNLLT